MDVLQTPIKQGDPIFHLVHAIRLLSQRAPGQITNLVNALPQQQHNFLKECFQSQNVKLKGTDETQTRRIVKVRRTAGVQQQPAQQKGPVKIPERK